jgi:hypothetical protein
LTKRNQQKLIKPFFSAVSNLQVKLINKLCYCHSYTGKGAYRVVCLAWKPAQKEAFGRQKKAIQNEKKVRKRLFSHRDNSWRNQKEDFAPAGGQHQSKASSH